MKVLMPYARSADTGSVISGALLSYGLMEHDHKVTALFPVDGPAAEYYKSYGTDVDYLMTQPVPSLKYYSLFSVASYIIGQARILLTAYKYLKKNTTDVVHCNDDTTILPWSIASKIHKVPCVWHVRVGRKGFSDYFRCLLSTKIICITEYVSRRIPKSFQRDVIYNPVDFNYFNNSYTSNGKGPMPSSDFDITFLFVGRDVSLKRPEWVLSSLRKTRKSGINACLIVLGVFSPERQRDLKLLLGHEHEHAVHFAGFVSDPERYLSVSDILLHPAVGEGFGRVFIEAAACGVPAVGVRSGGSVEAVIDGQTGVLVDENDLDAFISAAVSLAESAPYREELGTNALKWAENFSITSHAEKVAGIYASLS